MNTTDTVLLIVLTSLLSLFFIICITIAVVALRLLLSVKRVVVKAETVVDSVESVADVFRNVSGKATLVHVIKNIIDLAGRKK